MVEASQESCQDNINMAFEYSALSRQTNDPQVRQGLLNVAQECNQAAMRHNSDALYAMQQAKFFDMKLKQRLKIRG